MTNTERRALRKKVSNIRQTNKLVIRKFFKPKFHIIQSISKWYSNLACYQDCEMWERVSERAQIDHAAKGKHARLRGEIKA